MARPIIVPIGPSIAYIQLTRGHYALIDSWNAARCAMNWHARQMTGHWYAYTGAGIIALHRHLCAVPKGMVVDHRNRNTLDNRECNLREATHSQNCCNRKRSATNTSGIKGVCWDALNRAWLASIKKDGVSYVAGRYASKEEAIVAQAALRTRLHGDYARNA